IDPGVETLSAAGHFALDMKFKAAPEKHYRKMCPHPLVTPSVQIYEEAVKLEDAMPKKLQLYGEVQWAITQASKTLFGSFVHTIFSGLLNFLPYILDVLSPKYSSRLRRYLAAHEPKTRLVYKKENKENEKGWDLESRIVRATAILKGSGFSDNFSPYVFVLGHGSSSLNNPHEAAHDCGACAGGRGAPNGRLFATICNEPEVRVGLAKNGVIIPDATRFIGGYHNTCSDEVLLFDLPDPTEPRLQKYIDTIRRAAALDAKERCRRFDEVKTDLSEKAFADYARGRAMDLTQPRPEYGHCTNAMAIVGPRYLTRNLFLDRRSFLISYNYQVDPIGKSLRNILGAVGPVCAGINLEYYFSFIDNEHYGCGTKLPHNIASLVGVMNGHLSDLQLGLPWQMVEVHEPTRLILLVCCKVETMETILDEALGYTNQPGHFQCLVKHNWIT
ncbi:MAG: putative inorganic carbon transporter subunit DabA, partial [Planctomycetota bacterium]